MKIASLSLLLTFGLIAITPAVDFDTEIFPILKNRCAKCHMEGESKGKVSLDKDKISREIGDGVIVPGDVKKSDLHWTMTLDPDDDAAMPPKGARVPPDEIALIAKWIEEGAKLGAAPGAATTAAADSMTGDDSMSGGASMEGGASMSGGAPAAARKPYKGTFKNNSGKQLRLTTLTRIDGDRAILVLPDGKEYRYPIAMFAPETQEIVQKFKAGTLPSSE